MSKTIPIRSDDPQPSSPHPSVSDQGEPGPSNRLQPQIDGHIIPQHDCRPALPHDVVSRSIHELVDLAGFRDPHVARDRAHGLEVSTISHQVAGHVHARDREADAGGAAGLAKRRDVPDPAGDSPGHDGDAVAHLERAAELRADVCQVLEVAFPPRQLEAAGRPDERPHGEPFAHFGSELGVDDFVPVGELVERGADVARVDVVYDSCYLPRRPRVAGQV